MQTADPDAAIEALAAVFRTMPRYPLVDTPSATALYQGYEDWARHFLTGTSAPLGSAAGADPAQRHWASAQVFFRERRQIEQSQVQRRDRELTGLAQDLLLALRDTSVACGEVSGVVEEGLQRVQALLAGNSLEQLRSEFAHMAARMRNGLAGQRAIFEQQLGEMRQRVEAAEQARAQSQAQANALGSSLAELRQALEETRQQMQLDPLTRISTTAVHLTTPCAVTWTLPRPAGRRWPCCCWISTTSKR